MYVCKRTGPISPGATLVGPNCQGAKHGTEKIC